MKVQQEKKVTLRDVAQSSDVSLQTVSRILSGKTRQHSKTTVQKVSRTAEDLGYFHRQNIYGLTRSVGVVVDCISEPAYVGFNHGVHDELLKNDYLPVTLTPTPMSSMIELVELLMTWRVDGIIIRPERQYQSALIKLFNKYRIPLVTIGDPLTGVWPCDHVGVNGAQDNAAISSLQQTDLNSMGWQAAKLLMTRLECREHVMPNRKMLIDPQEGLVSFCGDFHLLPHAR